jgi:hypothetical protein
VYFPALPVLPICVLKSVCRHCAWDFVLHYAGVLHAACWPRGPCAAWPPASMCDASSVLPIFTVLGFVAVLFAVSDPVSVSYLGVPSCFRLPSLCDVALHQAGVLHAASRPCGPCAAWPRLQALHFLVIAHLCLQSLNLCPSHHFCVPSYSTVPADLHVILCSHCVGFLLHYAGVLHAACWPRGPCAAWPPASMCDASSVLLSSLFLVCCSSVCRL